MSELTVIGGGLAGCEAAWQVTSRGIYDAIAPFVVVDSINVNRSFWDSRYKIGKKGEGEYPNCPFSEEECLLFSMLLAAERFPLKSFEEAIRKGEQFNSLPYFESCLPIEILAEQGPHALIFSPLRPVGIPDPRSTERPYAIVQIRQDNIATTLFNLIGCQTNLTCKEQENLFLAGQITVIEGYAWNIASVLVAGFNSNRMLKSLPALVFPLETMIGTMLQYITNATTDSFQPMKANFGFLPELEHQVHNKKEKYSPSQSEICGCLRVTALRKMYTADMNNGVLRFFIFSIVLLFIGVVATKFFYQPVNEVDFNAERAYQDVLYQTSLGARTPGSTAHEEVIEYISQELTKAGWKVVLQQGVIMGHTATNIIARRNQSPAQVILGAHYDSRFTADRDAVPDQRKMAVPGANDGASGVAVLLELARTLPQETEKALWLVFFDLEDQGNIEGWDWILGSRLFAEQLASDPEAVIIVDMVGDADLNIHHERNSDPQLTHQIWSMAAALGYSDQFIDQPKYSILDDHTPFREKGIRAVDIIDFDYPYWHTVSDTADKVSPHSLEVVGKVLLAWLTR